MDIRNRFEVKAKGQVGAGAQLATGLAFRNLYRFEARDKFGRLKWVEEVFNLTTTQGLNDVLTKYFKGASYTAAWSIGLVDNASFSTFAAGDTAAQIGGSNAWIECIAYDETTRQTLTLGSASAGSIDNSAAKAVFTINATKTIKGAFIASASAKSATTGVLFGEAAFSSARSLLDDDTLTVTVTLTAATA